jgi:hypothetical protein
MIPKFVIKKSGAVILSSKVYQQERNGGVGVMTIHLGRFFDAIAITSLHVVGNAAINGNIRPPHEVRNDGYESEFSNTI